jgi:hypothetical protein
MDAALLRLAQSTNKGDAMTFTIGVIVFIGATIFIINQITKH